MSPSVNNIMNFFLFLIGSFFLVAFGQPALIPYLGIIASSCGFALFWRATFLLKRRSSRFWVAVGWFAAVQGVQTSWMASPHYMGSMILVVYGGLIFCLGLQFGLLSLFLRPDRTVRFLDCLGLAGVWVLMEWSRLFVLTGFSFNPVGLALSDTLAVQWAALGGVFFLSFWVIFVNLLALKRNLSLWVSMALLPYLFGWVHPFLIEKWLSSASHLRVALVQTALLPEQKSYTRLEPLRYIPMLDQWVRIWRLLPEQETPLDLIVLPEAALPYGASRPLIPYEMAKKFWVMQYGVSALVDLPPLEPPFAFSYSDQSEVRWKVTHSYFAQALANHFQTDLIVGLDDEDEVGSYNAAFHFHPKSVPERYEKRVLVPVSEYLPLDNIQFLSAFYAKEYGIFYSCTPGVEAKVFKAAIPIGPSICYEETYGNVIRQLRLKGAELFVNVTNDVWYPNTRLPQQHFHHGRIRAVENGVYLVRSCNTGVTGAVDCFGKVVASLPVSETKAGVLFLSLPLQSYPTLYTFWGDSAVLILSVLCLVLSNWKKLLPRNGKLS